MFLSTVIPLTPREASAPARFFGREAHALFLDLVRRADPALAESLHAPRGDKPFTVGILDARARAGALRITAFEPRLAQCVMQTILPNLPGEIRFGHSIFTPGAPITDHAAHPWAGIARAEEMVNRWFALHDTTGFTKPVRADQVTFHFATPTAHRQIHRNIVFPIPAQLWGGWLRAWNAHAQPAFEDDLLAQVEANVALSRYTLQTEIADFGEHRAAGWIGRATFNYFTRERALWRVLNVLADFAFYCGTGYKTTQGMGMTRRVE